MHEDLREFLDAVESAHRSFDAPPILLSEIVDYHLGRLSDELSKSIDRRAVSDAQLRSRLVDTWRQIVAVENRQSVSPVANPFGFEVARLWRTRQDDPPPTEAPVPDMALIGREKELEQILDLMNDHRLVSIVGPGGVGKSTLMRAATAGKAVLALDCGVFANEDEFLGALGARFSMPEEGWEAISRQLSSQVEWLVLDQIDADGLIQPLVQRLLSQAPDLKILTARRTLLGLPEEASLELAPFSLTDPPGERSAAVQLFVETVQRTLRSFQYNASTRGAIREICRLALGIPLSITIAAASLNHQSLNDTLNLFRNAPAIQREQGSIRASVDHSFQLLSRADRVYLCRLSSFAGRFSFEDAQYVCGVPERELSESLVQFQNAGLISVNRYEGGRNYLLHDLAKDYSRTLLLSREWQDETQFSVDRYQLLYAKRAREIGELMTEGRWTAGIQTLYGNHADLRQAMRRCVESRDRTRIRDFATGLSRTFMEMGRLADFDLISEAALGLHENSTTAKILGLQGALASINGDSAKCMELWQRRRQIFEEDGDVAGVADCLSDIAWELFEQGDIDQASQYLDEAERLSSEAEIWELAASMQVVRARILLDSGQDDLAQLATQSVEATLARCHDKSLLPFVYQELAGIYRRLGDEEKAIEALKKLLSIAVEGERAIHAGRSLRALAPIYEARGEIETAGACYFAASQALNEYQSKDRRAVEAEIEAFLARYLEGEGVFRESRNTPWQDVARKLAT